MSSADIERIGSSIARRALHGVAATRQIETAAASALPPFTLMARAGEAVARLALALAPHAQRVVVFSGPGNNGGDGFEAAMRLRAFGKACRVVRVGSASHQPPDAAQAHARAVASGVEVVLADDEAALGDAAQAADFVIDALLGIGARRPLDGALAAAVRRIAALRAAGAHVLAVDVPSGLDAESGRPSGADAVVAHDTLAMLTLKPGLFTADGRDHAGRVWLASLGADAAALLAQPSPTAWLVGSRDTTAALAPRQHAQHKGSFGDVAIVGGAPGMGGAALLAAQAALAAGAGRVFVELLEPGSATSGTATPMLDPARPELMWRPDWSKGGAQSLGSATVVCGCGGGDAVRSVLPRLLSAAARLVLDADALNAIAADTGLQALLAARARHGQPTVLTPHPLEAARLMGTDAAAIQAGRREAAQAIAERFGAVVVLKGSGSVIAAPGDVPRINTTGNASLGTAGTGDVLAGWLGGRWAAGGRSAFDAATGAVIEHGAAAEPARAGPLRAADLVESLYRNSRR